MGVGDSKSADATTEAWRSPFVEDEHTDSVDAPEPATDTNFKRSVLEGLELAWNAERVPFFRIMAPTVQQKFLHLMVLRRVPRGTIICAQGAPDDYLCIIRAGVVKVQFSNMYSSDMNGARVIAELQRGDYFGERALLQAQQARATCVACTDLELFACSRHSFEQAIGGLADIIGEFIRQRDALPELPRFSELEVRHVIGLGTFARVMLVRDPVEGWYALKAMRKAKVIASKQEEHVLAEKEILENVSHPFVNRLVATYQSPGELYMLLELAVGGEFFSILRDQGKLPDTSARFYVACVVSVISHLHKLKVVYRDLKPENLMLDELGYVKVIDFGFAKRLSSATAYRTTTFCGTPDYVAPELVLGVTEGRSHGFGVDWWAVAVFAFQCLAGSLPFAAREPKLTYAKILKGKVQWPKQPLPEAPRDLIKGLLVVKEEDRFGSQEGSWNPDLIHGHKWFKGLDFRRLTKRELAAPHKPGTLDPTVTFRKIAHEGGIGAADWPGVEGAGPITRGRFTRFAETWV